MTQRVRRIQTHERRRLAGILLTTALVVSWPERAAAQAQEDSVTVIAGPRYRAGSLQRLFLGSGYRDLWTTPIRVPVLRPDTFAGGLTVLQRGESLESPSLRFRARNGRQYVFRSVDKEQAAGLPADLQNTVLADAVQDLVATKHPGAAVVVGPLLDAAGVLHAPSRLAVMADHPLLGAHRDDFAGRLGTIEERPDDEEGAPGFGPYRRIIGSERLLERLEESSEDRVDSRAYLTARLMDVLVGDWDRHPDQFRWALDERGERFWLPIPRDRDNALSYMDGFVGDAAALMVPTVLRYRERYTNLYGLLHNAQALDRPILADLPLSVWDSVARELQRRITDGVIASAVARLPAAWRPIEAEPLASKLRARRDALPHAARALYYMMAREVDVYGTDEPDHADVERLPDGTVRVRLTAPERKNAAYFERLFLPGETRELRVHLRGGRDRAAVRGRGGSMHVRVLGGGNDDVLEDFTEGGSGGVTALYDSRGANQFRTGRGTRVDRREFDPPDPPFAFEGNPPPPRDWGTRHFRFFPDVRWSTEIGPVIGGGPVWTRYGFRRFPYASHIRLTGLVAPATGRFGVEAGARFLRTGGGSEARLAGRATQLSVTNFHGYGNETPQVADRRVRRVYATEYELSADLASQVGRSLQLTLGPRLEIQQPDPRLGSPAIGVPGSSNFGVAGLRAGGVLDTRDSRIYPRAGLLLRTYVAGYPAVWGDAPEAFATGGATGSVYVPLPGRLEPTLALRLGAERVWGQSPFQYAAFLGGAPTLRGYRSQRFAGDAAVHGNGELRTKLGRANLLVARGEIGALALADVGRVFVSGESSSRWHSAFGGGLWFAPLNRAIGAHLLYAYGERHTISAGLGMPF